MHFVWDSFSQFSKLQGGSSDLNNFEVYTLSRIRGVQEKDKRQQKQVVLRQKGKKIHIKSSCKDLNRFLTEAVEFLSG